MFDLVLVLGGFLLLWVFVIVVFDLLYYGCYVGLGKLMVLLGFADLFG